MRGSRVSLERTPALTEAALISEAFAEFACAENGHERPYVRAYVVDELVLTVTERELGCSVHHDNAYRGEPLVGITDLGALQRRTTVEQVTGRRVTTTLSGRLAEPDVNFDLFILAPDPSAPTADWHHAN